MPGRITPLSPLVLVAALLATSLAARDAHAHRLDAQLFVLPNRKIQVEGWFSGGDAAKGAKVQIFSAREELITEGQLDELGIFVFSYNDVAPCTVVISAGAGHRKSLSISALSLAQATAEMRIDPSGGAKEVAPAPVSLAERDSARAIKDVFVGVGFLLALAAFVLSLRNARKLRALGQSSEKAR